jgi:mannose-6-phosphate isomerase-like protein (cupin superfamily)
MQNVFYENVEKETINNNSYRKVVYTGKVQFVYMNIKPLDNIHMEVHKDHDQFIRIEKGHGIATINGITYKLSDGIGLIIPAGFQHKISNTSAFEELKLYTIYTPPEHADKLEQVNNPDKNTSKINNIDTTSSDNYLMKYLKYKQKYLALKK